LKEKFKIILDYRTKGEGLSMSFIPPDVKRSLIEVVKKLDNLKVKYLIIGAIPVLYYGRPRLSWDIDIVLATTKDKMLKIFRPKRYSLVRGEKMVFKFRDLETNSFIDVLLNPSDLGLTPESFERKKEIMVNNTKINIPSPEDYIITKLISRRARTPDYMDTISTMLNMYEELDWLYLERRAKTLRIDSLLKYYKEGVEWRRRL